MMSNWNPNITMTSSEAGMYPLYTMGGPQNKPILAMPLKNEISTNRKFSIGFGIFESVVQKFSNIFIRSHIHTLEKHKQSLSTPDIFVDKNINTPIFEALNGKTKLTIPENEPSCDQTKSLSAGNSPFDWRPITNGMVMIGTHDHDGLGKHMNITTSIIDHVTPIKDKDGIITRRCIPRQCNTYPKSKMCNKRRKKKNRSNLLFDIMDEYRQLSDTYAPDSEAENNIPQNLDNESNKSLSNFSFTPREMNLTLDLSEKSFPTICPPLAECTNFSSHESDTDSENSFVIFSDSIQDTTPAILPQRKDLCTTINKFFTSPVLAGGRRQRQISECSDDSIVFCNESDHEEYVFQSETDLDSDDEEQNSCLDDSEDTISHQPDSGFEERKVQFNLKPEVHVMRTWDYAYRQARKGEWEMAARDRERFKKRIHETEEVLSKVFDKHVRDRVYKERFSC